MRLQARLLFCAIASLSGCTVNTPLVEKLTRKNAAYQSWTGEGIVYALPMIAFDVQIAVSKTVLEAPVCGYAALGAKEKMLLKEVLQIKPEEIQGSGGVVLALHSATLTSRAVPDPKEVYVSRFPTSSGWADSALIVKMGPLGTVDGAEGSASSKAAQVAAKVLEFAGSTAAGVVGLGSSTPTERQQRCNASIHDYETLENELKGYRAKPTPFSKETLETYQKEIRAEQATIQAMFLGRPTVQEGTVTCSVSPQAAGTTPVLDIYPRHGVTAPGHVSCQVDPVFSVSGRPTAGAKKVAIQLNVTVVDELLKSANSANLTRTPEAAGFFYRVPVRAFVSLSGHAKVATKSESYLLPQLGAVRALPQARGSNPALVVELHPETGALKSVKVSNSAADLAGVVGSAGTAGTAVLSAVAARRDRAQEAADAEAAKQDPLAVLTREQGLLEAELAIATAKEALRQLHEPQSP